MTGTGFGMIPSAIDLERISDASPNTGRTLAGTANAVTVQKKLRKKEDDMHNRPIRRTIHAVSDSAKDTSVSRHDVKNNSSRENRPQKGHIDVAADGEEEAYEPFIGVLVDYTA
ncbi:MAG: hypothetical protein IJT32_02440 [Lachnospiraceae bacterium]|nr:hypothetical protein [Lachnospiraceae bacterium]